MVTWWGSDATPRRAYAVAAAIGLLAFCIICGPTFAIGTSSYWDMPGQDHRAYMVGYRYFLAEPWHWPVLVTHTMSVPFAKSIAFTDSIPIWALIHKAIGTVVPPWDGFTERAYLGLWYVLVFVLQACFGVAILRQLGQRSWAAVITTSVMFLALPSWLFRFSHASLDAQWLLLWAILLYLRTPTGAPTPRRLRITQLAHLALCSLVNPYHAVASLALFVASLLRSRQWRSIVLWSPLAFASIGAALWLAGYFQHDAKIKMWGFEAASANVLTFFLPRYSGLFGESLWRDGTGYQYEGLAYLGAGVLLLLVLFLPSLPSVRGMIRRHPYLLAIAVGLFLFALSNHIFVGTHPLLSFKYPRVLRWVTYQFRCPGRFVWIPMYLIVIVLLNWALTRFRTGWRRWILAGVVILQVVDAWAHAKIKRAENHGAVATYLNDRAWEPLMARHSFVYVMPTHDCILAGPEGIQVASTEIQYLASVRALPINGVYSARPTRDCDADPALWPVIPAPGGLYVFLWMEVPRIRKFAAAGATCATIPFGRVCSVDRPAIEALIAAGGATPLAPPPSLAYGQQLAFDNGANEPYLEAGWSWPDPDGRWTDGLPGTLVLQLAGEPPEHPMMVVQGRSIVCGDRTSNDVDVLLNGRRVATLHFDAAHNDHHVPREISIQDRELLRGPLVIELRAHDMRPLSDTHCNDDRRGLGIMLRALSFR